MTAGSGQTLTNGRAEGAGSQDSIVFQAGTHMDQGILKSAGGRVLVAVGLGENMAQARDLAYRQVRAIQFPHHQSRTDIALEALNP
jgi:phosphoribosylamine--glycine ligase